MQAIWRRITVGLAAVVASVALVPGASAAIRPTLTLDQSAGTAAGSTANLGMDLEFAPNPGTDSPKDLTLKLPAGLLANAAIDGGACLKSATPVSACQVGTGTVTASDTELGLVVPLIPLPVRFDLVAPPPARRPCRPSAPPRGVDAGYPGRHHRPAGKRPGRGRAEHRLHQRP
jgi:hypothetical protein